MVLRALSRASKPPRAAAEVQHAGPGRDQFDDAVIIEPVLMEDAGRPVRLVLSTSAFGAGAAARLSRNARIISP